MPIEVKHGADPSAMIYSRFGGAEGRAWRSSLERYLLSRERRELQRRSQGFQREMSDVQHFQQMQKLGIAQRHDVRRLGITEGLRQERIEDERDFRREMLHSGYEYRMTAQQREDESRLRNALYQIEQDESLSPEERQEARRRVGV
jgi:hypothetical protein